jgi:hypothetical protein
MGACILFFSTIGGFVPDLWHAGMFSMWGVLFSVVGGFVGVWVGYRVSNSF